MAYDSVVNGSPVLSKDLGKKKRNNRTAKLKQYKLDARREQWLSQVKNKECKEELNVGGVSPPPFRQSDDRKPSLENLETRSRGSGNDGSCFNDSDLESMANSPTSSLLGANDSSKDRPGSSSGSSRSSSSGCYSGTVSEEEEDDGCLDDWEAIADALNADDKQEHPPNSIPTVERETPFGSTDTQDSSSDKIEAEKLKLDCRGTVLRVASNGRAWRPDDAYRPQSLPNLSKQHSFDVNAERHCGRGAVTWACHSINSPPSSCPICYEDLDLTDSSFLPCSCGFRLCLFCHKRILEADARCPGCRKQYDPSVSDTGTTEDVLSIRLGRSCSMGAKF